MSGLTVVEWKEKFVEKLAEELEDTNLAFISDARVEEFMEMYGDGEAGVKDAVELEKGNIDEIIRSAKEDMEDMSEVGGEELEVDDDFDDFDEELDDEDEA